MRKQYHILNGDLLKQQFPDDLQGEIIVARECLVDGDVTGVDLDELFQSRSQFISNNYEGCNEQDYYEKTVPEFQKIESIDDDSDINLWFEDDLFCQVNFWFVVHLINKSIRNNHVFLIRPESPNSYSFGGLNKSDLNVIYKNRLDLQELDKIASLWVSYQNDDLGKLIKTARELESTYPFILPAAKAHLDRKPTKDSFGRPTQSLLALMRELETKEFEPVFREFSKRESIYGFGDLQVKRLFDEIKNIR